MEDRPDPDQVLKRVQAEEKAATAGRLKLFFGASAGVGKTYAMLEAARERQKEGWDVLVGVVETHGRAETAALLQGLAVMPRKALDYKGVRLEEFDIDAALSRRPKLILVDELAHTNAPGSRHAKRWQDVEELLDAGIHVYTTLNVQHWESLNDVVAKIMGVAIHETVPDSFLQRTHDVELVDLAPDDLLQRLRDGKVYQGDHAQRASENFFQPGNLIALRELALRHAAERVDAQMQAYQEQHALPGAPGIHDHLLVGVSPSPMSARLIRATHRMATRLHGRWTAVHVETPAFLRLPAQERGRVLQNLRLAEKLGAQTLTLTGHDIVDEIIAFARKRRVTKIVVGKPARARWREWLSGSVVNELARRGGDFDLFVISGMPGHFSARRPGVVMPAPVAWAGYGAGLGAVAMTTLLCWPLLEILDRANLIMVYLMGIMGVSYRYGRKPAMLSSLASVLAFDYFFVPPNFSFAISDAQYFVTFAVMLAVGVVISTLAGRLRSQTESASRRQERLQVLYQMSRSLSETADPKQILPTAWLLAQEIFENQLLLLEAEGVGVLRCAAGNAENFPLNEREIATAQWVADHDQSAGAGTDTLAGAFGLYLPLKGREKPVGVLAIRVPPEKPLDPEQTDLLEALASEIGGAYESTRLTAKRAVR